MVKPFNWLIKISGGNANNKYYNMKGINVNERIALYKMLKNYLNPKLYKNIPKYIQKMVKHYCEGRVGGIYRPVITPPYYVSFSNINSDQSMFNAFRSFFFSYYDNKKISPKKVRNIFKNCTRFYDQNEDKDEDGDIIFKPWKYSNEEWCKYKDCYEGNKNVSFSSFSSLIKKSGNIVINCLICLHC